MATADGAPTEDARPAEDSAPQTGGRRGRKARALRDPGDDDAPRIRRVLVPALAVLLVLLLAATAFLWFTRPDPSAVRTGDYVGALQAAKANVVDMTSFDYLTLDDDIEQIRRVTTGDLRDEAVDRLDSQRQQLTDAQTVVNTEVVSAGVVSADDSAATVLMQLQTTTEAAAGDGQAQVSKYRIEVQLKREDDRWLLSGITGR